MSSANLIRLGGLAAVVAGVLFVAADLLSLATESENMSVWARTTPYLFTWILYLLGAVLLLVGLVSLYVHQSEASGILGFVGFVVAFLGTASGLGAVWAQLFIAPYLAVQAPGVLDAEPTGSLAVGFILSFLILFPLGWLLFGIASLRARVYPRAAAIVLIVGAVAGFLPLPATGIVLDVAVAWLGFVLFARRGEAAPQPSRVS